MNTAVGIDVSKGKSAVCAMRPFGEVVLPPREYAHTPDDLTAMVKSLLLLGGDARAIMEATGRYHEPVVSALRDAGIRVSLISFT